MFAALALQPQNNLLRGFRLLVKDGLGLTTVTRLFAVVTALTLSSKAVLAFLVLSNLMQGVLPAFLTLAVSLFRLRNVHLQFTRHSFVFKRFRNRS